MTSLCVWLSHAQTDQQDQLLLLTNHLEGTFCLHFCLDFRLNHGERGVRFLWNCTISYTTFGKTAI
jgi:hypothetical protein